MTMTAGTKYRVETEEGSLSEVRVLEADMDVNLAFEDDKMTVFEDANGKFYYVDATEVR
jgi:hypothetical protein